MFYIAESRDSLDTQICIRFTTNNHILTKQVVQRALKKIAKLNRLVHFGLRCLQLPFRYSLTADIHFFSQLLLCHISSQMP